MSYYRVSDRARTDMDAIWLYIAEDNMAAADKLIRAIVLRFAKLATLPDLGRPREELSSRLQVIP